MYAVIQTGGKQVRVQVGQDRPFFVAACDYTLIGEELYAGGAYLGAGKIHEASITAQDVLRWIIIALILVSVLLNLIGFNTFIEDILAGSM